jgi:predicted HAD superfamily Cof-like phosphohydrolase
MNADYYSDIAEFHKKFKLEMPAKPILLDAVTQEFRTQFMIEELREFCLAHKNADLVKAADALVDLTYVVLGTAYLMGLPFRECWDLVHCANLKKQRAVNAEQSKRGSMLDVVKPAGWVSPEEDLQKLLKLYGAE